MTYSDLNIDLSEMITEELRLGFLQGIEFRLSHLFISFRFRDSGGGLKSTPRHGAACQEVRHGAG